MKQHTFLYAGLLRMLGLSACGGGGGNSGAGSGGDSSGPAPITTTAAGVPEGLRNIVYWSSSSYADSTGLAWVVNMNNGNVHTDTKTYSRRFLQVRAGQ